jgi:hypothetical protein
MCTGIVFQSDHELDKLFNALSCENVMSTIFDITDGNFGANLPTPALNAIQQIKIKSTNDAAERKYMEMDIDQLLDVLQEFGSFDNMPTAAQKALKEKTKDQ